MAAAAATDLAPALAVLLRSVGAPAASLDELAQLVAGLPDAAQQSLRSLVRTGVLEAAPAQEALQKVLPALAQRAELPAGADGLVQALRTLARSPEAPAQPAAHAASQAAAPESWEAWLKAGTRTLADPALSPQEAAFHAAQGREGTALFEVPLPWSPGSHLQMWVEQDGGRRRGGGNGEDASRVLLGLNFSRLGETRLGIARGPEGLQVRVWAEHPALLAAAGPGMEAELGTLGLPVDLKILPLEPDPGGGIPTIRSLAQGATFQVLG